jgi:phosphate binding protein
VAAACAQPTEAPSLITSEAPTEAPAQPTTPPATPEPGSPTEAATEAPAAAAWTLPSFLPPAEATGEILTAGSSTVFPLSEAMAEAFEQEGFNPDTGSVIVDSIGTGAGFERFCTTGESDIANASRPINANERAACAALGRVPLEFRVGTDALAVVVSSENDFVDSLTLEQLALVYSTATTWQDVNPEWPAEPIQRFSPGTDSGTFDYFVEAVMRPTFGRDGDADRNAILNAEGVQFSENDNTLAQGVEGSPFAIAYFGFAYYQAEGDRLRAVTIEGVEPSQESVDAGTYPLARPLFLYSDPAIIQAKPQVASFLNFYLTQVGANIAGVGYFPAPAIALERSIGLLYRAAGISVDASAVPGDVITAGSSTVFPLTEAAAASYEENGGGNITVDSIGTGAGFERFCESAESDISNASRPIKDDEVTACQGNGRTPIEFRVGTDALAVVVSADNEFIDYLTLPELAAAYSTAATWADVRAGWPAEPIQRFSPGTDSGTFDYFVEAVMDPVLGEDNDAGRNGILNSANTQFSENDNTLAQGVEGSPFAIAYFGFAYYQAEGDLLRAIPIVPEEGEASAEAAIAPDASTAESGEYPLARPLFIYSDATLMQEKPQVAAFILYYLTNVNDLIGGVGYFPASENALGTATANWMEAMGLTPELAQP